MRQAHHLRILGQVLFQGRDENNSASEKKNEFLGLRKPYQRSKSPCSQLKFIANFTFLITKPQSFPAEL